MATKEYKKLGCLDVNPTGGCAFEVRAETEDEVMRLTGEHAKTMHKMASIPPEMASKVKSAIKSVSVTV
jgi:predicted small metal-binding protein